MFRYLFQIIAITLFASCNFNQSSNKLKSTTIESTSHLNHQSTNTDTIKAKEWLSKVITDFFHTENLKMEEITTTEYASFKNDAMNVDLEIEGSLSQDDFVKKWNDKYDLSLHPVHTGFLISGQDWGLIQISQIRVKEIDLKQNTVIFSTVIRDEEFKTDYKRDIKIKEEGSKYLIADVLEYD